MCPRLVIVVQVASDDPPEVTLVENDAVIKALATNRADESLNIRRLPRRAVCSQHLLDTHMLDSLLEERTVDAVAITNHEPWRCVIGKSFDDLLSGPFGSRMRGDIEVDDVSAVVAHDHKGKEYAECSRRSGEEVDGDDVGQMIVQECSPGLRRWLLSSNPVLPDGSFGDCMPKQCEFGLDARNSPIERQVEPPEQGKVVAIPQVGGLHHRYRRAA